MLDWLKQNVLNPIYGKAQQLFQDNSYQPFAPAPFNPQTASPAVRFTAGLGQAMTPSRVYETLTKPFQTPLSAFTPGSGGGGGGSSTQTGPGGIALGSYPPQSLTQDQRQWLWEQFGHSGQAPIGYGGEQTGATGASSTEIVSNSVQKLFDDIRTRGAEFDAKNPFSMDELLSQKRKEVASRLDPYYNQTLEDYVQGVQLKRSRSVADERRLLTDLTADTEYYTGQQKAILDEALDKSAEGLADVGLLTSGVGQRAQGQLIAGKQATLADYIRGVERRGREGVLTGQRYREGLGIEEALKKRDIERERYATTQSEALGEARLAAAGREAERNAYIGAPYSTGVFSDLAKYFANV